MKRFAGEQLPAGSRIAVIANDAIGNFVVATPLLQMIRRQWNPIQLDYYGGTRTIELQEASDLFDWSWPLHGTEPSASVKEAEKRGPYDLVVNVEQSYWPKSFASIIAGADGFVSGPTLDESGRGDLPYADDLHGLLWADREWIAPNLMSRYSFLESPFIAEIYARASYLTGPIPSYRVPHAEPQGPVPDLLIAASASLPEKLWPLEKWRAALQATNAAGLSAGLLGAKPKEQKGFWKGAGLEQTLVDEGLVQDLRGQYTMPQVVGALAQAKRVLTLDNGILHLAVAAGAWTVGLYRFGIHRLWAPPSEKLSVITPAPDAMVADIDVDPVLEALRLA